MPATRSGSSPRVCPSSTRHELFIPGDPEKGTSDRIVQVTPQLLAEIAANNNKAVRETGDMVPLVEGHTRDGVPESEQPEILGYADGFSVGPLFNTGRQAILAQLPHQQRPRQAAEGQEPAPPLGGAVAGPPRDQPDFPVRRHGPRAQPGPAPAMAHGAPLHGRQGQGAFPAHRRTDPVPVRGHGDGESAAARHGPANGAAHPRRGPAPTAAPAQRRAAGPQRPARRPEPGGGHRAGRDPGAAADGRVAEDGGHDQPAAAAQCAGRGRTGRPDGGSWRSRSGKLAEPLREPAATP